MTLAGGRRKSPKVDTGIRFDRLLVISKAGRKCVCRCDCGTEREYWTTNITQGWTRSCGCQGKVKREEGYPIPLLTEVWRFAGRR